MTEDSPDDRPYDVAISFLSDDQPLAQRLHDELAERWDVFLFTERQEEIAGKDGVEELSRVFGRDSKLNVVLFREGWGEEGWTRVESDAIRDCYFNEGADRLFVINLDGSETPPWVHDPEIWWAFDEYGLEAAVGAIDSRAEEVGAEPRVESALERAERLERERQREEKIENFLQSRVGVQAAEEAFDQLGEYLEEKIKEMTDSGPEVILEWAPREDRVLRVCTNEAAMIVGWHRPFVDSLSDACIVLRYFAQPYSFRSLPKRDPVDEEDVEFAIDDRGETAWERAEQPGRYLSVEELGEFCLNELLEHHYGED